MYIMLGAALLAGLVTVARSTSFSCPAAVVNSVSMKVTSGLVSEQQETSYGKLRGQRVGSPDGRGASVIQFLGVPYGKVNERFFIPQGANKWTGQMKDATSMKPVCPQLVPNLQRDSALTKMPDSRYNTIQQLNYNLRNQNEDCLYMNIFVPETNSRNAQPDLHTLLIVHGDEFSWGSGNAYNGSMLASYGRIIVATINYRLGPFGFLAHCNQECAPSCPAQCKGNGGLVDMVVALDMLTQLVTEFGGHSDGITLMGWGSGAAAVNLLMTSPFASPSRHRKFKRAVLLSGSALSPWAMSSNPQRYFYELAQLTGCRQVANAQQKQSASDEAIIKCMRTRDVSNITSAASKISPSSFLGSLAPIVDGMVVVNSPLKTIKEHGSLFQGFDLLVGLNSNDAFKELSDRHIKFGITPDEREKIFRTLVRNLFQYHRTEIYDALVNEYTNWAAPKAHAFSIRDGVLAALNDALYVAPAVRTADLHAKARGGMANRNTFMYVFDYETSGWPRGDENRVQGAIDGEQVLYLLGYPYWMQVAPNQVSIPHAINRFNQRDAEVSMLMMRVLSNFVKGGDPLKPSPFDSSTFSTQYTQEFVRSHWQPYSEDTRQAYKVFGRNSTRLDFYYRASQVAFWNELLPRLQATGKDSSDEHNQLPDHFDENTYFGVKRPYGEYFNMPFPMPPTPPPSPAPPSKIPQNPQPGGGGQDAESKTTIQVATAEGGDYSFLLSITVSVGCALLVLNILIFAGIYHQRDKQKRNKKKMQLHYHSYEGAGGYAGTSHTHTLQASPMATGTPMMPPAPPPPQQHGTPQPQNSTGGHHVDGDMRTFNAHAQHHAHHLQQMHPHSTRDSQSQQHGRAYNTAHEQEPLLNALGPTAANSGGGGTLGRQANAPPPGVSPTCPRHGRAAMVAAAAAQAIQQHQQTASVEEIQV